MKIKNQKAINKFKMKNILFHDEKYKKQRNYFIFNIAAQD